LHYITNHHITTSTQCTLTTDSETQQMFNRTLHYTEPTETLFNTFRLNFRHTSVHKHRLYGTLKF